MAELSDTDRRIVTSSLAEVTAADIPKLRKIHEDRLADLRPTLFATQRAIAMREASLALLDELENQ